MRKWHRWLVVFTGVLLIWVAATGLVGQVISLTKAEAPPPPPPAAAQTVAGPATASAAAMPPAPAKPAKRKRDLYHFIIDLHSGAILGPVGKVISAVLGAAMLFFAGSGMWMYVDMFRKRRRIGRTGLFWK